MSVFRKFRRVAEVLEMSRQRGLAESIRAGKNRYQYDHVVSKQLPAISPTTPYHIQIETSRVCNLRCKMCEYSYMENKGDVMDLPTFQKILGRFPALMSVDITGIGEAFCNPHFLDIVEFAKSRGIYVGFVNNGNLMTEERMDAVIEMGVDLVQFSVDAATKETHESIRRHSKFDRVTDRIAKLCEKVEASGKSKPVVHMNFTMSRENFHETRDFVGLAKSLGVREVSFRFMTVFEGGEYGGDDQIDTLSSEELQAVGKEILIEAEKHGVTAHLDPILTAEADQPRMCMRPWMDSFVDVFGNLYPCCLVTQRNEDMSNFVLGNLLEQRFEDIWNNETYQQLRSDMAHPTRIPPICDGCVMLKKENGRVETEFPAPAPVGQAPRQSELVQINTDMAVDSKVRSS